MPIKRNLAGKNHDDSDLTSGLKQLQIDDRTISTSSGLSHSVLGNCGLPHVCIKYEYYMQKLGLSLTPHGFIVFTGNITT